MSFGGYYLMFNHKKLPVLLQKKEGINQINEEARDIWRKHMYNLTNVKMLEDLELNSYTSIKSLGEQITLYPASNMPAHIQVRSSKNRIVKVVFIFEPGTKPQWDKISSAIEIDANIFVMYSSGWKGE